MSIEINLDKAFYQFISNKVSNDFLKSIKESISTDDVDTLIEKVESLNDPSEYCENNYDNKTVTGFFLFIDFISALIIDMGAPAMEEVRKYNNSKHPFVPWVVKYVDDDRFHNEIISKFSKVFSR